MHHTVIWPLPALLFFLLVIALAMFLGPGGGWVSLTDRMRKPSMGAVMVARLLRADPEGWSGDRHVLSHLGSKINIWVANDEYGLTWWLGEPFDFTSRLTQSRSDRRHVWVAMKARTKILGKPQDHGVITAAFAALNGIEPEKGDDDEQ